MPWVKIPAEHHPLFHAALPKDPRAKTVQMFGGVCGTVNGNMFGGLFGRSFMVKLDAPGVKAALALDGAEPFDPMGTGRVMHDSVLMPEDVLHDPAELRAWLARAFEATAKLPPKEKKPATKLPAKKKPAAKAKRR